jgi:BNR repeat-like domain
LDGIANRTVLRKAVIAALGILALASCEQFRTVAPLSEAGRNGRPSATLGATFQPERRWGGARYTRWEPVVAADRSSRWVYQMTTEQHPDRLLFRRSRDGGRSWSDSRRICRHAVRVPFQYDPQLAVAADGTVEAVCLDGWSPGVVFTQSHDRGRSWSAPVRLDGSFRYSDKPTLTLSPSGRDIYVAFNVRYALYVAATHDGGATWQAAVRATTRRLWYYSLSGTVAPDGSVWFAVDGESGHDETGAGHIALVSSSDGGGSWRVIPFAVSHEGAPCRGKNCYPDFFTAQDAVAADSAGEYVFVYAQNRVRQGPNQLFVTHSRDGKTWSAPAAIATEGNSTSPAIVAGPQAGDFRLVWQDNRFGPRSWNTWYAQSSDGGAKWSAPIRLSDSAGGASYKNVNGYFFPFGDYLGLSVDGQGCSHVIWGEGAGVYYPGGTWWTRGPDCN